MGLSEIIRAAFWPKFANPEEEANAYGPELSQSSHSNPGTRATSRLGQGSRLKLRLRGALEGRGIDRALNGFEPSFGPCPLGYLSDRQLDAMPNERRELRELERRRAEDSVDSDSSHVAKHSTARFSAPRTVTAARCRGFCGLTPGAARVRRQECELSSRPARARAYRPCRARRRWP